MATSSTAWVLLTVGWMARRMKARSESLLTDELDFDDFVRRNLTGIQRFSWLLVGDVQRAEDLTQTALSILWAHWGDVSSAEPARRAYLRTVITRRSLRMSRLKYVGELVSNDVVRSFGAADSSHSRWDRKIDVLSAVKGLPPRQRAVVLLRYLEDYPICEVARCLGISEGTAKSQAHKALKTLEKRLGKLYFTEGMEQ